MTVSELSRALLLAALPGAAALASAPQALQPFAATYAVEWRGMGAGMSTLELQKREDGTWVYDSRNVARGVFRLAFPNAITQTSTFRIEDGRVVPLSYRADDGSNRTERDISLDFDWSSGRVTGTAERRAVSAELSGGVQDSMSVQIALMRALANDLDPKSFRLIDKDEVKEYQYAREGTARIETPLGAFDTVIYRSQRVGSSRVTRMWHAPALGYVPVRAEQVRGDRIEWRMSIRALKRPES